VKRSWQQPKPTTTTSSAVYRMRLSLPFFLFSMASSSSSSAAAAAAAQYSYGVIFLHGLGDVGRSWRFLQKECVAVLLKTHSTHPILSPQGGLAAENEGGGGLAELRVISASVGQYSLHSLRNRQPITTTTHHRSAPSCRAEAGGFSPTHPPRRSPSTATQ
jgi:hypothetical protein